MPESTEVMVPRKKLFELEKRFCRLAEEREQMAKSAALDYVIGSNPEDKARAQRYKEESCFWILAAQFVREKIAE